MILVVVAILGLALAFPAPMLAPGPLQPGHAALTDHCFACHDPFAGPDRAACEACHTVEDIGLRLVSGAPRPERPDAALPDAPFHQALGGAPCADCHAEHGAPTAPRFKHALLDADQRDQCAACHTAPADGLHRGFGAARADCAGCHTNQAWRPATFEHSQHFDITGEHRARCETCHPGATAGTVNLERYTCDGCHAHSAAELRAEHAEEGIRDLTDCARCHRSGDDDDDDH